MNDFAYLLFTIQKYSSFNPPHFPKRTLKFFFDSIPACSVTYTATLVVDLQMGTEHVAKKWDQLAFLIKPGSLLRIRPITYALGISRFF